MADDLEEIPASEEMSSGSGTDTQSSGIMERKRKARKQMLEHAAEPSIDREGGGGMEMKPLRPRRSSWVGEETEDNNEEDKEIQKVFREDEKNQQLSSIAEQGGHDEDDEEGDTMGHSRQSSSGLDMSSSRQDRPGSGLDLTASANLRQRMRDRARTAVEKSRGDKRLTKRIARRMSSIKPEQLAQLREMDARDTETRVEEALERSFELRRRVRDNTHIKKSMMPTEQEQYDFFTKTYDKPVKKPTVKASEDETAIEIEEPAPIRMVRAKAVPYFEQVRKEAELYFTPSFLPVPMDRKVSGEVRHLEEEGLYVGPALDIAQRNINAIEQRLIREKDQGRGWFTPDGQIIRMQGGLANFPLRPEFEERDDLTFYCKAVQGRGVQQQNGIYLLDVDISKLVFTHHPLFSKENVLTMRLLQLYKNYLKRAEQNLAMYYGHKLHAVQIELKQLEHRLSIAVELDQEPHEIREIKNKIQMLCNEAKEFRQQRNNEEANDRRLMQQMLDTWNWIKQLRQTQKYNTTSFQLMLRRQAVDEAEDKKVWDEDLRSELREKEQEFNATIDNEHSEQEEGERPQFDRQSVWREINQSALSNRRNPGQPIYVPVLTNTGTITPSDQCPQEEKDRRTEIGKQKLFVRIFFNEMEVCKTNVRAINSEDFFVTFAQIYSLHIYEMPQTIELRIYEQSRGTWEEIACLGLPIPQVTEIRTEGASNFEEIEFSSPLTKSYPHAAVGSGNPVSFDISGCPDTIARTTGVMQCSVLWGRGKDGVPLVPPIPAASDQIQQKLRQIGPRNPAAIQELQEMLKTSKFDPNDPVNSQLASVLKDIESYTDSTAAGVTQQLNCFRLEPEECSLISEEEFYADLRYKMLELRRDNVPEFRALKMVPAYASEIDTEIFKRYEKRLEKEKETAKVTGMESLRAAGLKYARMIRAQLMERFYKSRMGKNVEDVVKEIAMPELGDIGAMCGGEDLSRPLKPQRRDTKRQPTTALAVGHVKILFNIQSGSNIPQRSDVQEGGDLNVPEVEPCLEVTFQGNSVQTSVIQGKNPTWQQILIMDFIPPNNDFSADNLKTCTDVIYMNLFDQVVSKLPKDNREGSSTVHEQIEKHWLGSIQLPFSTLYWNGKIDGALRVKVPAVFSGYNMSETSDGKEKAHPYIKMLMALEPVLPLPETIHGKFDSIESTSLINNAELWAYGLTENFPKRRYLPLVLDTNGRTVIVCRFLKTISPPPEVMEKSGDLRKAADLACRIVSLIPFVSDTVLFPGMCDIWTSCDEFMRMLCGDEEEHAVLLWCWLSSLDVTCSLLIGCGLPEGPRSAYVLARFSDGNSILYNASDGQAYALDDPFCPLLSVGCIVTPDNIYGNNQLNEHPSSISFDLSTVTDWKPLFNKGFPNPGLDSVQPSSIEYVPTDQMSVTELRGTIEREIKQRFDEWRPHGIPQWNYQAAKTLRDMLPLLEEGNLTHAEHAERLKTITDSYKMCGFPLHMGYESADKIVEAVKATNVHVNYNAGVEFALAVHIHPYCNNILSVWVYIASLIRLR